MTNGAKFEDGGGFAIFMRDGNFIIDSGGTVAVHTYVRLADYSFYQLGGNTTVNGAIITHCMRGERCLGLNNGGYYLAGGALNGNGTIDGSLVSGRGYLSPGTGPGTLTIKSNFYQIAGNTLVIQLAGREAGRRDQLRVEGAAHLGGKLIGGGGTVCSANTQLLPFVLLGLSAMVIQMWFTPTAVNPARRSR